MRLLGCIQKCGFDGLEAKDTVEFIEDSNMEAIQQCMDEDTDNDSVAPRRITTVNMKSVKEEIVGKGPDLERMCLPLVKSTRLETDLDSETYELDAEGLNESEIDSYLLSGREAGIKNDIWENANAGYLQTIKEKSERLARERLDGKPERKKRKVKKKVIGPSSTASEAIEKILQEKKISSKINYDILKSLTDLDPSLDDKSISSVKKEYKPIVNDIQPDTPTEIPVAKTKKRKLSNDENLQKRIICNHM